MKIANFLFQKTKIIENSEISLTVILKIYLTLCDSFVLELKTFDLDLLISFYKIQAKGHSFQNSG